MITTAILLCLIAVFVAIMIASIIAYRRRPLDQDEVDRRIERGNRRYTRRK